MKEKVLVERSYAVSIDDGEEEVYHDDEDVVDVVEGILEKGLSGEVNISIRCIATSYKLEKK